MKAIHKIPPIYDENSKILILGTMPSVISREKNFYYAHPQNRFWKILEMIFNTHLDSVNDKKDFLIEKKIALWDVVSVCDIKGSNDATITNIVPNNIDIILRIAKIECIFCTGKKSYTLFQKYFNVNIPVICLPSPSSANAIFSLEDLIKEYSQILNYLPKN